MNVLTRCAIVVGLLALIISPAWAAPTLEMSATVTGMQIDGSGAFLAPDLAFHGADTVYRVDIGFRISDLPANTSFGNLMFNVEMGPGLTCSTKRPGWVADNTAYNFTYDDGETQCIKLWDANADAGPSGTDMKAIVAIAGRDAWPLEQSQDTRTSLGVDTTARLGSVYVKWDGDPDARLGISPGAGVAWSLLDLERNAFVGQAGETMTVSNEIVFSGGGPASGPPQAPPAPMPPPAVTPAPLPPAPPPADVPPAPEPPPAVTPVPVPPPADVTPAPELPPVAVPPAPEPLPVVTPVPPAADATPSDAPVDPTAPRPIRVFPLFPWAPDGSVPPLFTTGPIDAVVPWPPDGWIGPLFPDGTDCPYLIGDDGIVALDPSDLVWYNTGWEMGVTTRYFLSMNSGPANNAAAFGPTIAAAGLADGAGTAPEPGAMVLLALGALGIMRGRRP